MKQREEYGRQAKQLLDYGRVDYLHSLNMSSKLIQYVEKSDTLENISLVACPMSSIEWYIRIKNWDFN